MLAVDTNVLVRLVTADDTDQFTRAHALFDREEILLLKTVLLETEWVLRRKYGLDSDLILNVFQDLAALPNVECEDLPVVKDAIQWARDGMDFADALHLASARTTGRFATLDRRMIAQARRTADVVVIPI